MYTKGIDRCEHRINIRDFLAIVCHYHYNEGTAIQGGPKKTGPLCSAEILLRSARFFCRNRSRLILNTKT